MAEFKLVISDPKSGKSYQRELKDDMAKALIGLRISQTFKGELIGLAGYEFMIMGGSDNAGFPMRFDIVGTTRKRIFTVKSIGVRIKGKRVGRDYKGSKIKKSVAGNTVFSKTAQINVKVIKEGKEPLAPPAAEAKEEAPAAK